MALVDFQTDVRIAFILKKMETKNEGRGVIKWWNCTIRNVTSYLIAMKTPMFYFSPLETVDLDVIWTSNLLIWSQTVAARGGDQTLTICSVNLIWIQQYETHDPVHL